MAVTMKRTDDANGDSTDDQPEAILFGPEQLDQITLFELRYSTTRFLPSYHLVPEPFKLGQTKWNRLFSDWFYSGVSDLRLVPRRGWTATRHSV